jgi:hypothetical protein
LELQVQEGPAILLRRQYNVQPADFQYATVGRGAFEQKTLLFSFGRIPFSTIGGKPLSRPDILVHVRLDVHDQRPLEAQEKVWLR